MIEQRRRTYRDTTVCCLRHTAHQEAIKKRRNKICTFSTLQFLVSHADRIKVLYGVHKCVCVGRCAKKNIKTRCGSYQQHQQIFDVCQTKAALSDFYGAQKGCIIENCIFTHTTHDTQRNFRQRFGTLTRVGGYKLSVTLPAFSLFFGQIRKSLKTSG